MLRIDLSVNGKVVETVIVTQVEKLDNDPDGGRKYLVNGKSIVYHQRKDGIIVLAYRALAGLLSKAYT